MDMKTFKVVNFVEVYIDNYETGEGDLANHYELISEIKAKTPIEAIQEFFLTVLFYTLDLEHSTIDDNVFHYSNLVGVDSCEATDMEIERWKNGNLTLWSANSHISVYEVSPCELEVKN